MLTSRFGASPFENPIDILLADVAIRVQLSQTNYDKAISRYQAINDWIERDDSPLKGRVQHFYAQGSMAIGAAIASKLSTDEFDIDVVVQNAPLNNESPRETLDTLCRAVKGEPGSRYFGKTRRRTRCVTVQYGDGMHLDLTPAVRLPKTPERESLIFHHKPETLTAPGYALTANPYGFAIWFRYNTPRDDNFADIFESRANDYDHLQVNAGSINDPVPPKVPPLRKSKAVIVLQLLKRWRNVQYEKRSGRRPPSIMISWFVANAVAQSNCLTEELLLQAQCMLDFFQESQKQGKLIYVANPVCSRDKLTDRWPRSNEDQHLFIQDLEKLVDNVGRMISGCDLEEIQQIMVEMFGEQLTGDIFRDFNERIGEKVRSGRSRHVPGRGGLVIPGVTTAIAGVGPSVSRATPSHQFYGSDVH